MHGKTWTIIQYEESGLKFPPDETQQNYRMVIKPDHTTQSIECLLHFVMNRSFVSGVGSQHASFFPKTAYRFFAIPS